MFSASPAIAHLDMDAFFAAVEQRDFPELRGKPVVVGSHDPQRRGVVSAASYEAREYGIHSALPLRTAYRLCPNACFVDLRPRVYSEESRHIMAILHEYSPRVQPLSLDEAFFDLTGTELLFGPPEETVLDIKRRIQKERGLVSSVGLASVKFVAKIASDLDKPDGVVIVPPGTEKDFLHPLKVQRLWGVGPKTFEQLEKFGVATIGDLAGIGQERLIERFGKWGLRLWNLSQGIDPRGVEPHHEEKSVGHEHTYDEDQDSVDVLERTLLALSEKVARRLRKHGMAGRTLTLKFRTASFRTLTRSVTGSEYLDQGPLIYETARALMKKADRRGEKVRLLGVSLSGLLPRSQVPRTLFDGMEPKSGEKIDRAVDELGRRYGTDTVQRARLVERRAS